MTDKGAALVSVMAHVGVVEKDRTNKHFGYDYQSEAAIKLAAQKAFVAEGVAPDSITLDVLTNEWRKVGNREQNIVTVKCIITFGGKPFEGLGSGADPGDKAILKAQTAAYREALKGMLCVPSHGDPEEDQKGDTDGAKEHVTINSKMPGGPHEGKPLIECPEAYLEHLMELRNDDWGRMANAALNAIRSVQDSGG